MQCAAHALWRVIGSAARSGFRALVLYPLLAAPALANSGIHAASQGPLTVGGITAHGAAESVAQGVPTWARITAGAIVEREVDLALDQLESVRIALRNPHFTTTGRIAQAISGHLSRPVARVAAPAPVALELPPSYRGQTAALLTEIEQLWLQPDQSARVVIDERSGTVVTGAAVPIREIAVVQGNLTVRVTETPPVPQPNPGAAGDTVAGPHTRVEVEENGARMTVLQESVSLQDLVDGLNAVGVGPRDLIGILRAIKAAGALQAEIVVM